MDLETAEDIKRHFDATAGGLRDEVVAARGEIIGVRGEVGDLRGEVVAARGEVGNLRGEVVAVRGEVGDLRGEIGAVDEKVDRRFEELKRHFEVIAEALRGDIRTVAEGFVGTNDRLDRFQMRVSDRFGEMETMIRLSFGELARRIQ
jgi:hypothetical protein